jgi:cell division protein FtsB
VSDEAEGRLQANFTETARLRDVLAAIQASQQQLEAQIDSLRTERDRLLEQARTAPAASPAPQEVDPAVLQKALEGVSTRTGWPWFGAPRNEKAEPAAAPVSDQAPAAAQQDFSRERATLQAEVARLKKDNALLRQYLENFGVQLIEM